mgnify:CR=1 FL=1
MINSILKAIDIMTLFSTSESRLSLGEISRRLGIPKSTAHHLLATLLSRGFIERVDGDQYALGTAIMALTQAVRVNVELRDRAAPLLRELADTSRESAYLTVREGDYCLYIYAVESPHRLLARTAVGDKVLMHCTSVGKAILAFLSTEDVREIVARTGLPTFTNATITDVDALCEELEKTRARGYALDYEEHETGTFCIGAPIVNEHGQVIGALSISGADPAIVRDRVNEMAAQVIHAAHEVSRRMGYVPPRMSAMAVGPNINQIREKYQ